MITRVWDWRLLLCRWAWLQPGRPFVWGETDCAMLARTALAICFGGDIFPGVPRWKTPMGAARALARTGGFGPMLLAMGATETTPAFARTGDVCCFPEPEERVGNVAIGVWVDVGCLLSSDEGVLVVPRVALPAATHVYSIWEVPEVVPLG